MRHSDTCWAEKESCLRPTARLSDTAHAHAWGNTQLQLAVTKAQKLEETVLHDQTQVSNFFFLRAIKCCCILDITLVSLSSKLRIIQTKFYCLGNLRSFHEIPEKKFHEISWNFHEKTQLSGRKASCVFLTRRWQRAVTSKFHHLHTLTSVLMAIY